MLWSHSRIRICVPTCLGRDSENALWFSVVRGRQMVTQGARPQTWRNPKLLSPQGDEIFQAHRPSVPWDRSASCVAGRSLGVNDAKIRRFWTLTPPGSRRDDLAPCFPDPQCPLPSPSPWWVRFKVNNSFTVFGLICILVCQTWKKLGTWCQALGIQGNLLITGQNCLLEPHPRVQVPGPRE